MRDRFRSRTCLERQLTVHEHQVITHGVSARAEVEPDRMR